MFCVRSSSKLCVSSLIFSCTLPTINLGPAITCAFIASKLWRICICPNAVPMLPGDPPATAKGLLINGDLSSLCFVLDAQSIAFLKAQVSQNYIQD